MKSANITTRKGVSPCGASDWSAMDFLLRALDCPLDRRGCAPRQLIFAEPAFRRVRVKRQCYDGRPLGPAADRLRRLVACHVAQPGRYHMLAIQHGAAAEHHFVSTKGGNWSRNDAVGRTFKDDCGRSGAGRD